MMLPDGTVIPSGLGTRPIGGRGAGIGMFTNTMLRAGRIIDIVYPGSPNSVSKTHVEYRVAMSHREGGGGPTTTITYANCAVADLFGGIDTREYRLRVGAQVLVLCLDGQSTQAYILAGLRDTNTKDAAAPNHHYLERFHGVSTRINADGEWSVTFGGARTVENKLDTDTGTQEDDTGTVIKLGKLGDFLVQDGTNLNSLVMDHRNGTWTMTADSTLNLVATQGSIQATAGGDYLATATGGVRIKAGGNAILESGGLTYLGAGPGLGNQSLVLGDTYRNAEKSMHTMMQSALVAIVAAVQGFTAAGAALNPPSGPALTQPAGVALAAAGVALGTAFSTIATAIATFESLAPTYLSQKVKTV